MNYIFFGTPNFAAVILEKLIDAGFIPAVVVCNPDRPVGRKKIILPPPTKILVEKYDVPVFQPQTINNLKAISYKLKADLFIVAAYSKIIPKEILDMPRLGTIGAHPSLLPRHRGATPIQTAILSGDKTTGVTLFLVDEKIDHGKIIANCKLQIANSDTYEMLEQKLADAGAELLIKFLTKLNQHIGLPNIDVTLQPQDESQATYTKKFTAEDAYVDLEKNDSILIERKVRALNPEPGAWTIITPETASLIRANKKIVGKRMKILTAEIVGEKLSLKKIQVEGKKPQKL